MITRTQIKRKRLKARRGRLIDEAYKSWIREQPCCICYARSQDQKTHTESAHVGDRGLGQKCSDRETLPICEFHHTAGSFAHHKLGVHFWTFHSLDRDKLIAKYQEAYAARD